MDYDIDFKNDLDSEGWPNDWNVKTVHSGLSRNTTSRRYSVRLSVAGAQRFIACASSQHKGAMLYDLALWKLAAFIPRVQPNFPEDFDGISQAHIDGHCPNLNTLYSQVEESIGRADDLTEDQRREAALARMNESKKIHVQTTVTGYERYSKLITKFRVQSIQLAPRILAERVALNFVKFPELQQAASDYEAKLQQADAAAAHLQLLLTSHSKVYKNFAESQI